MNKSLDTQFDLVTGLSWYPWVTNSYKKIMILGESNYGGWEEDEEQKLWLKSKEFTRNRIAGPASNGNPKEPTFRNLERAIFNCSSIDQARRESFWNSVAYMNQVQRAMSTDKERPTRADYAMGWQVFEKVNSILQPEVVIVLGTEVNKVQTFRQYLNANNISVVKETWSDQKNGSGYEYAFEIDHPITKKVVFIKHTSQFFSWQKCALFLNKVGVSEMFKSVREI